MPKSPDKTDYPQEATKENELSYSQPHITLLSQKHTESYSGELFEMLQNEGYQIIIADPDEQVPLGCNVLAIDNNKVIAVAENKVTNQRLRDNGVEVIEVSMPNIIKKGGGPRCLTCPTNRESH